MVFYIGRWMGRLRYFWKTRTIRTEETINARALLARKLNFYWCSRWRGIRVEGWHFWWFCRAAEQFMCL